MLNLQALLRSRKSAFEPGNCSPQTFAASYDRNCLFSKYRRETLIMRR
jgi:hypothetical protein